jgi:hypothetical protein
MTEGYLDWQRAEGKIRVAARRMAERYPFHAALLGQFRLTAASGGCTMGVTLAGGDVLLLHNPAFVLATPADDLVGVLLHEVHHAVLGHLLADPADFPDEWARTVAEEVSANEFIREPLPGGGITLASFPGLPPMESTAQRYLRLRKVRRRPPLAGPPAVPRCRPGRPAPCTGPAQTAPNARLPGFSAVRRPPAGESGQPPGCPGAGLTRSRCWPWRSGPCSGCR